MGEDGEEKSGKCPLRPYDSICVPSRSHVLKGQPFLTGEDGSLIKGVQEAVVLCENLQITLKGQHRRVNDSNFSL